MMLPVVEAVVQQLVKCENDMNIELKNPSAVGTKKFF